MAKYAERIGQSDIDRVIADAERDSHLVMPKLDFEAITNHALKHITPGYDRVKDFLVESIPDMQLIVSDLNSTGKLIDPEGEIDIDAPGFLDHFAPQVRDRVLTEIDHDDYDYEYTQFAKTNRVTPETMSQFNRQFFIDKQTLNDRDLISMMAGSGSGESPRQAELANLFTEVNDSTILQKKLEEEVQQLKNKIELEASGGGAESATKTEDEGAQAASDDVRARKKEIVRDFKHLSPEQIKEWEVKAIKVREDAIKQLTESIDYGKKI
ncbi:hypothetical protein AKO1_005696 [Acrasis kona]|uniref:Uncharacterized protein n=1 Tax=Acrasis kona TaxID=1008807 RepID=A0AAW2YJH0_9EUKA